MGARRLLAVAMAVALALGLGGAGVAYATPAPEATRLMFIGDSIMGSPGCWRAPVWVALTDAEWDVDMVGIQTANECGDISNAAGQPWDPDNTGIGGVTTTRMWIKLARDKVLEEYQPQVIVMLLGTNDLLGGSSAEEILAEYDKLLALYRDYDSGIEVVVGTPPPIDTGVCGCDDVQAALAAALPAWAAAASTEDSSVTIADLSTGFDPAVDTDDGIHPNDAGNAKLAAAWLGPIEEGLQAQGVIPIDEEPPPTPSAVWVIVGLVVVLLGVAGVVVARRGS